MENNEWRTKNVFFFSGLENFENFYKVLASIPLKQ